MKYAVPILIVVVCLAALCLSQTAPVQTPQQQTQAPRPPKPLMGHLRTAPPDWVSAYPEAPAGQLALIYTVAVQDHELTRQREVINALQKRLADLEQKVNPPEAVKPPEGKGTEKK